MALAAQCLRDLNKKIEYSIPFNIISFCSHVNSLKNTKGVPAGLFLDGSVAERAAHKCELVFYYFSSMTVIYLLLSTPSGTTSLFINAASVPLTLNK